MRSNFIALAVSAVPALAQSPPNLTSILTNTSSLSNLTTYVQLFPDLVNQLSAATNVTLLAPSNAAFSKLLNSSAGMMLASDTSLIQPLLTYHVLNGTFYAENITSTPAFVHTSLTNSTYANVTGGQVVEAVSQGSTVTFTSGLLQKATVSQANIQFTGGVIHIIDSVLTVPLNVSTTAVAANLTSAAGALTQAMLVDTVDSLSDVTVFVPDNAAFQAIGSAVGNLTMDQITSILEYHVVNGTVGYSSLLSNTSLPTVQGNNITITVEAGSVFVNSAKVVQPDVLVANGVVHVLDNVLNPNNTSATPNPTASTQLPAFSGASSASGVPFTSGVPTPTSSLAGATPSGSASASGSSVSAAAAMPLKTGAVGAAALFGAGAAILNL